MAIVCKRVQQLTKCFANFYNIFSAFPLTKGRLAEKRSISRKEHLTKTYLPASGLALLTYCRHSLEKRQYALILWGKCGSTAKEEPFTAGAGVAPKKVKDRADDWKTNSTPHRTHKPQVLVKEELNWAIRTWYMAGWYRLIMAGWKLVLRRSQRRETCFLFSSSEWC